MLVSLFTSVAARVCHRVMAFRALALLGLVVFLTTLFLIPHGAHTWFDPNLVLAGAVASMFWGWGIEATVQWFGEDREPAPLRRAWVAPLLLLWFLVPLLGFIAPVHVVP